MFHWMVLGDLGDNTISKELRFHRCDEKGPIDRNIESVGNMLSKLVIWREDNLSNILLKVVRIPWARSTGNMRREPMLAMGSRVDSVVLLHCGSMGSIGRVSCFANKWKAFGVNLGSSKEESQFARVDGHVSRRIMPFNPDDMLVDPHAYLHDPPYAEDTVMGLGEHNILDSGVEDSSITAGSARVSEPLRVVPD